MGLMRISLLILMVIIAASLLSTGESTRILSDGKKLKSLFETQLPRGPVPPSGPSTCHNSFYPFNQNDSLSSPPPPDSVLCP